MLETTGRIEESGPNPDPLPATHPHIKEQMAQQGDGVGRLAEVWSAGPEFKEHRGGWRGDLKEENGFD